MEDITAYPTWKLPNGEKQKGAMSLEKLAKISNFRKQLTFFTNNINYVIM